MDSKKILLIAIIALAAIVSIGSCSAGLFDFMGGNTTDASLDGQEVHLAAAASLKNAFDNDLIPMFEQKYPGVKLLQLTLQAGIYKLKLKTV